MKAAEENNTFNYIPGLENPNLVSLPPPSHTMTHVKLKKDVINSEIIEESQEKRKSSLDDFELEIEGINLDDNIDTSVRIN